MLSVYNPYLFYHLNSFFLEPLVCQLEISTFIKTLNFRNHFHPHYLDPLNSPGERQGLLSPLTNKGAGSDLPKVTESITGTAGTNSQIFCLFYSSLRPPWPPLLIHWLISPIAIYWASIYLSGTLLELACCWYSSRYSSEEEKPHGQKLLPS